MEIDEIINKLFGDIMPLADQRIDDERYENLVNYETAFESMMWELIECAKWKNDNRYSANRIGEKAYEILNRVVDTIQDELRIIEENE